MLTIEISNSVHTTRVLKDGEPLGRVQSISLNLDNTYLMEARVVSTPTGGEKSVEALLQHGFVVDHVKIVPGQDPEVTTVVPGPAQDWYCTCCKGYHRLPINDNCDQRIDTNV